MATLLGMCVGRTSVAIRESQRHWGTLKAAILLWGLLQASQFSAQKLQQLHSEAQARGSSLLTTVCCWAGALLRRGWCRVDSDETEWLMPSSVEVPHDLECPITRQLFVRPVLLHGVPFEESALRKWLATATRHPLFADVPAFSWQISGDATELRALCAAFAADHGSVMNSVAAPPRVSAWDMFRTAFRMLMQKLRLS